MRKMTIGMMLTTLAVIAAPSHAQFGAGATIDFSQRQGLQKSMLGMNHGAVPTPAEADRTRPAFSKFIDPLDFRIWSEGGNLSRTGFVEMIEGTHPEARSFLRLGAGLFKKCSYDGPPARPYLAVAEYKAYLRCATAWARDHGIDVLDVWNEPNMGTFLGPSGGVPTKREAFFETFRIAHETILEEWPAAVIAGPSLGKTKQELWLREFMEFCERERLEVPILTWHENGTLWKADWFADLPTKLRRRRTTYVEGPDFPHVGVREIVVNELGAKRYYDLPASNLAVLYYLERGGADGAARTCWSAIPGAGCFENTLNGLVTLPDANGKQEKRPVWWTLFYYKKSLPGRVGFDSDFERLIGMANDQYFLLGLYGDRDSTAEPEGQRATVGIRLEHLEQVSWLSDDVTTLRIKKREIPFDGSEVGMPRVPIQARLEVPIETAPDGTRSARFSTTLDVHSVLAFELADSGGRRALRSTIRKAASGAKNSGAAAPPTMRPVTSAPEPDDPRRRFSRKFKSDRP